MILPTTSPGGSTAAASLATRAPDRRQRLCVAAFRDDFTIAYIFHHSNRDLPGPYKFAVLWSGWMLWWSGSFEPANIIILSVCGAVAGYLWYRAMRCCP